MSNDKNLKNCWSQYSKKRLSFVSDVFLDYYTVVHRTRNEYKAADIGKRSFFIINKFTKTL